MSQRYKIGLLSAALLLGLAGLGVYYRASQVGRYQQRGDNQCFDTATGEVSFVRFVVQLKNGKTVRLSANPANAKDANP